MQRLTERGPAAPAIAVVSPHATLTVAATAGVTLFERRPPVHTIFLGGCRLLVDGRRLDASHGIALPADLAHTPLELRGPFGGVAYLDARRYRFEDAQRLAGRWRGFVPGRDDLREAMGDALALPARRVDKRLLAVLELLENEGTTVSEAVARIGLSESRVTHLMTETLGAPPRTWRTWFTLRRALQETMFAGANLTQAAHRAGFADSAHLTRTCKRLMGVRPGEVMPRVVVRAGE